MGMNSVGRGNECFLKNNEIENIRDEPRKSESIVSIFFPSGERNRHSLHFR